MQRPSLPRLKFSRPSPRPLTLERLQGMSEPIGFFFYLSMFAAVLAIFTGAAGVGVAMLLAGAGLHVVRSSVEELSARRRARAERKREVRLSSHRAARRAREAQLAAAAAAPPEIRVTAAAPRTRRRANVR